MQGVLGDGDLMLICITPDEDGKFGFNVKVSLSPVHVQTVTVYYLPLWFKLLNSSQGGVDQKMPLSISHVKPDSPVRKVSRCVRNVFVFKMMMMIISIIILIITKNYLKENIC